MEEKLEKKPSFKLPTAQVEQTQKPKKAGQTLLECEASGNTVGLLQRAESLGRTRMLGDTGSRTAQVDVLQQSATEEARRKDEKPVQITPEEALKFAQEVFGIEDVDLSSAKELDSYDDRNYLFLGGKYAKFSCDGGVSQASDVIFKIHNGVESDNRPLIEAHNYVLQHLLQGGVAVPEPLKIKDGVSRIGWIDLPRLRQPDKKRRHAVRLLRYIPGTIIGQTKSEKDELWRDVGRFVGKMDSKLLEMKEIPQALRGRVFLWDLKSVPALETFRQYIDTAERKALQERVIQAFKSRVVPKIPELRQAVIQNDANEANMIIDESRSRVAGIIDFGDCLETCFVFEIAICMAYMMLNKDDPLRTASSIYAGYSQHVTLTEVEEDLLQILVCSRLVQSVTMSAFSSFKDPNNEYLKITATTGWRLLETLEAMDQQVFMDRLKSTQLE